MDIKRTLLILFCATSQSWAAFSYYSPVTVDHTKVPSTQTDFPVLVSATDTRFKTVSNGGHVQSASGFDIRPYSDVGLSSALTYELERYNATTGEVIMWVKIASLSSSTDTVVYLGYCDSALTTNGSSTATWSNHFQGVHHLKDGTTLSMNDSFNNSNDIGNVGATATAGTIDGAANFVSASSQYVETGGSPWCTAALTHSIWVYAATLPNANNAILGRGISTTDLIEIWVKSNGKLNVSWLATTARAYDGTGATTLSTGTWYHVAVSYDSSAGLVAYVNGSVDNTVAANGALNTSGIATRIGARRNTGAIFPWDGKLDEHHVADVARSADWIATEYNSGLASFEALGSETPTGVACPGVTINNGWFHFFPNQ